jgi:hypothetical protein
MRNITPIPAADVKVGDVLESWGFDDHHFGYANLAPSEAIHRAMVDTPCSGSFTVSMTVIEMQP